MKSHIPKPICKKCNREVDELTIMADIAGKIFIMTAHCHNQKEIRKMYDDGCFNFYKIERGTAFDDDIPQIGVNKLVGEIK